MPFTQSQIMAVRIFAHRPLRAIISLAIWAGVALGAQNNLHTIGHSTTCMSNPLIVVDKLDISFNNDNRTISFFVSGRSNSTMNITATLNLLVAGRQVYADPLDPCNLSTFVKGLCPSKCPAFCTVTSANLLVPRGNFSTFHSQTIDAEDADKVPGIAYKIPDIAATSNLQFTNKDTKEIVACVETRVTNGVTTEISALTYAAVAVAGSALLLTGASIIPSGGGLEAAANVPSFGPTFSDIFGWFQTMAMDGLMSVNFPLAYRNYARSFGFSIGLTSWNTRIQPSLDSFRQSSGGDLTNNSVEALKNGILVFPDGSIATPGGSESMSEHGETRPLRIEVEGTEAYAALQGIPPGNVFMSGLVAFVILLAAVAACCIFLKLLLEVWYKLFPNTPLKRLEAFRQNHWASLGRFLLLILWILYSPWVWLCADGFRSDSRGVQALAAITFILATAVLGFFSWKIWTIPQREGPAKLFEDEKHWNRYSLFYDWYRHEWWWIFLPTFIYKFVKGCILSLLNHEGLPQTVVRLLVEASMLSLLIWSRPYVLRSGNVISVMIQAVATVSAILMILFLPQVGVDRAANEVVGLVLMVIQVVLSLILVILMIANALVSFCVTNPHVRRHLDKRAGRVEEKGKPSNYLTIMI